jgi:hypothetical protein
VNSIDRSATFATAAATPEEAYAYLAGEAAKWLISPEDMEMSGPATKGIRELGGATSAASPSLVFDRAMELLLPVRAQVNQGSVEFAEARRRISEAELLTQQLPSGSPLRQDLEGVVADLRRSVPAGD